MAGDVYIPSFDDVPPKGPVPEEPTASEQPAMPEEPAASEQPATPGEPTASERDVSPEPSPELEPASEPAPEEPVTDAPGTVVTVVPEELTARLDSMDATLTQLGELFRKKIDRTAFEEDVLKHNSAEIERYRSGVYEQITTPLLKRVTSVVDAMNKTLAFLATNEDEAAAQQAEDLAIYRDMLVDVLCDFGVTQFEPEVGGRFESGRHTLAMPRILTGDPAKRGVIIEVLSPGYELHGNVLDPAYVRAYTYKKGYADPEPEQQQDKQDEQA